MGGRTGKRLSPHTVTIRVDGLPYAVTAKQAELYAKLVRERGIYLRGAEVRTARALVSIGAGKLRDDGSLGSSGNSDGERWWFTVAE